MTPRGLLRCPCCEKMQRRSNYIFCSTCWKAAPPKDRRAMLRVARLWNNGERTARQFMDHLAELVRVTRNALYGVETDRPKDDDVAGAYTE